MNRTLVTIAALASFACEPSTGGPMNQSMSEIDSGSEMDDAGQCPPMGAACNSLSQLGQPVQALGMAVTVPPATGGVVLSGMYTLTGATFYTGAGGMNGPIDVPAASTISVSTGDAGTTMDEVNSRTGCADSHSSGTLEFSVASLTYNYSCPDPGFYLTELYSVSAGPPVKLTLFQWAGGYGLLALEYSLSSD